MAVEARHLNLFPPRFLTNRKLMNPVEANDGMYNTQMGYGAVPSSETTVATVTPLIPMYSSVNNNNIISANSSFVPPIMHPAVPSMDSSVTSNGKNNDLFLFSNYSRKRPRGDSTVNPLISQASSYVQNHKSSENPFSFLGHDTSLHVQQQQLDIDRLISHHMDRVKMEMEEKRRTQGRRIVEAIEQRVLTRLRAKEEEIEKIGKENYVLEERVNSLCLENQIWRNLAQTNEAAANALRNNLERVLADAERTRDGGTTDNTVAEVADDEQSSCGSNRGDDEEEEDGTMLGGEEARGRSRACKSCGIEESCVLVLPCRHLCLCAPCGSTLHACPICKSPKNASVHLNLSSSQ